MTKRQNSSSLGSASDTTSITPSQPGSSEAHSQLVEDLLLRLGSRRDTRIFKAVVGLFYSVRWNQTGAVSSAIPIKCGIKGQADLHGLVSIRVAGRVRVAVRLEVEAKSGEATQTLEQKNWQRMVESLGGIYILARSPDDAEQQLNSKIAELERV